MNFENYQQIWDNNVDLTYRKVASSRPVYYSIFDHFWGATNQDVLLLPSPAINEKDQP